MANFLFFGNYNRPGPGVSKDEPQKPPYIRYFQLMGRKFGKLIQLNLLFFVPFLVVMAVCIFLMFGMQTHYQLQLPMGQYSLQLDVWTLYVVPFPLIFLSPFIAGLTYVTRNFAREDHAFVFSDYKDAIKDNWKAFLLNGIFLYVAYMVLSFSMLYYYYQMAFNWFFMIPLAFCFLAIVVLLFCQYYVPIMIVTFDLPLRKIYRNALILSIAGLWRNLLLTAIYGLFLFVCYQSLANLLTSLVLLLLMALFIFSFLSYTDCFVVYSLIDRLLIQPYYTKKKEIEAEQNNGEEQDSPDKEKKESEYVYVNGRMVKRSQLEEESIFEDSKHS